MADVREIPDVLEAAAQAASSGDLPAAEALLHEVVGLQEASVGPAHADLASTYNNLAVVCEMAGKPTDAEQFYRRSYAIASAALDADDPLVTTSFNNLREFCATRGVPVEVAPQVAAVSQLPAIATPTEHLAASSPASAPSAPQRASEPRAAAPTTPAGAVRPPDASSTASRQAASSRTVIVAVLAAAAVIVVLLAIWPSRETEPEADAASPPAPVAVAPAPAAPPEAPPTVAPTPPTPRVPPEEVPARPAAPRPPTSGQTNARVLEARLCQDLSTQGAEWRCVAPSNPANSGRLAFYTRVASAADIRVRHRWYHGNYLVQDVGLLVRANSNAGYRTYSRQTVNASGGGDWRVEVRTPEGALLREERFVVR
jgi:hypothetical protein